MNILIITEEDEFYLPLAVERLLKSYGDDIAEVVCARNPLLPGSLKAAKKFKEAFGLGPILSHALRLIKAKIVDKCSWLGISGRHYYSIKSLCKAYNVAYSHCDNVNSSEFIQRCKDLNIELIASVSPTQIFKKKLIDLPAHGCINIHTAKLPKYRGLYPVYWAMAHGEKFVGISIHYIEEGIDTGRVLLQDEVEIPEGATLDHMLTITKIKGGDLLVRAIHAIEAGKVNPVYVDGEGSYFSFPTAESYEQFKSHGDKIWY